MEQTLAGANENRFKQQAESKVTDGNSGRNAIAVNHL
jgi:hypothetical protein